MNVLLVTGGAKGIGRAIAEAFARDGWIPVLVDTDEEAGQATANEIGGELFRADVTDQLQLFNTYAEIAKRFGGVDCLVNSAGVTVVGPSDRFTAKDWERVVGVNLSGTFYSCQAIVEHLAPGGSIVNLASAVAARVIPERAAYVASKFGIVGVTRVLSLEWAGRGIRVNAIAPAWVDTPFLHEAAAKGYVNLAELSTRTPANRLLKAEEVATAARYLASPEASYISGHTLFIDAGWSAG